jgi:hypothetical protein
MFPFIWYMLRNLRQKIKRIKDTSAKAQCIASKLRGIPAISVWIGAA